MHRVLVEERRWIGEMQFLQALNFCSLLPGPEAQQLATYVGWKLHGVRGGLAAGLLFIMPGVAVMFGLTWLYATAAHLGLASAILSGVKAAVMAIVLQALLRITTRALNTPLKWILAGAALASLALLKLPFPIVVLAAGCVGALTAAWRPSLIGVEAGGAPAAAPPIRWRGVAATAAMWLALWAGPLLLVLATVGREHVLWRVGLFFSKLALTTFGGAYAALSYMSQAAVHDFGWLSGPEMLDALGLAETTPGPLILVVQFVAFVAGFRQAEGWPPFVMGGLSAALALWVTFVPAFLWIFVGAPLLTRIENEPRLRGALAAIMAAVVGVIANLTLWFSLQVLFPGGGGSFAELLGRFDLRAAGLAGIAALVLFRFGWPVIGVLALSAGASLALEAALPA